MKLRGDDADRRLDAVRAALDLAEVFERGDDADQAVAAHVEIAGVVEEDDALLAGRVGRLDQQRADHRVGAARLTDHAGAEAVEILAQPFAPLDQRAGAGIGAALHDDAGRLTRGVRVDDAHHAKGASHIMWDGSQTRPGV